MAQIRPPMKNERVKSLVMGDFGECFFISIFFFEESIKSPFKGLEFIILSKVSFSFKNKNIPKMLIIKKKCAKM